MLSTAAFNGLLKTLEEPPEHVKFIFATTEIRKVPITVLSRCQRFDLRRIDADVLMGLLRRIATAESVDVDDDALRLIAKAGEGSARDSLSLLDQAIAQGVGRVGSEEVRAMLGLADRTRVIDLFEHVMKGDAAAAMAELSAQYAVGADPGVVLADLAEFTHFVTRMKIVGDVAVDPTISEAEATRGRTFADGLSLRVLGRAWQILLKGLDEVRTAPKAFAAAEMVLIRLCFAADLPTPDEALKLIGQPSGPNGSGGGGPGPGPGGNAGGPRFSGGTVTALRTETQAVPGPRAPVATLAQSAPSGEVAPYTNNVVPFVPPAQTAPSAPMIPLADLAAVAAFAAEKRDIITKFAIERQMRPVSFDERAGRIEVAMTPDAPRDLAEKVSRKLTEWTGRPWKVIASRETGGDTISEVRERTRANLVLDARSDPTVAALLARFPGAKVVDVRVQLSAAEEELKAAPKTSEGDAMLDVAPAPIEAGDEDDPGWSPDD